eukprot:CAMPEP_0197823378 /NCGR_PEP_ID=MMETSP1437-20131217/714_1 /TAXON_ID=49252 ORGANISM="Eucampia antarctica, Strain CCMP1452" /NCGR_SAMPLE_ID=MMETSP1437 /ASSEMBLY_ACC=CAM_ASM_001096 /LENGTH=222 /DNA_ID=CAMNT_0043422513 /DNA_START=34 /DNA_END=702 /DNA_ORIENTATION=-
MSHFDLANTDFMEWSPSDLAKYLEKKGVDKTNTALFVDSGLDGKTAATINEGHLKEMGISKIGDRLSILKILETLKKASDQKSFTKLIWKGKEQLYVSTCNKLTSTCFGCCPDDPDEYTLQANSLEIKTIKKYRIGPCVMCCCAPSYNMDNIDMSIVTDVDVKGVPPSCCQKCCCGVTVEHLTIQTNDKQNTKSLVLKGGLGQEVAKKIRTQVEFMQRMERN